MKKTVRKILAAVLTLIMISGSATAFAAEEKESITLWSDEVLAYEGELTEGENDVSLPGDYNNVYVDFTAVKDGYYAFSIDFENYYYSSWICPIEKDEDGDYQTNSEDRVFYIIGEKEITTVYEFEAGEKLLGILLDYGGDPVTQKIRAEYMGTEITGIDFSAGIDYSLMPGYDIEPAVYEAPGYSYYFYVYDLAVTFDSGKTVGDSEGNLGSTHLYCSCETEMTDGEYAADVHFAEKTFRKTISVRPATAYISKIEALDPEKFYGIEYYNGDVSYLGCNATYKVTFTDGSTVQVGSETEFEIPGTERKMWIERDYNEASDGVTVAIEVGGHEFAEYPCEVRKATDSENFSHMAEECSGDISRFVWRLGWYYEDVENAQSQADKLRAFGTWISYFNNNIFYVISDVVSEFSACLAYTTVNF